MGALTQRQPRSLHLVDLENLAMNPDPSPQDLEEVLAAYHGVVPTNPSDLVVLSASTQLARRIAFQVAGFGRLVPAGSGPDAADLALLREAPARWVVERFDRLVIVSGDGIFAPLSATVRQAGRDVWVASWRSVLSRRLASAATRVCLLDHAYGTAA